MLKLNKKFKVALSLLLVLIVSFYFAFNNKTIKRETNTNEKAYNQVVEGEEKVNGTDYVTFDAFFLRDNDRDGNAESYRGASINLSQSDKLYLDIKILGDVTLKNGTVEFVNDNVKLSGTVPKSTLVKNTIRMDETNIITFNNVGNGTSSLIEVNINPNINYNLDKYSGTNKVIFKGTVVNNETNVETEVTKEISYDVDWYATKINMGHHKSISNFNVETLTATYSFQTYINTNAILRDVTIRGTISSLIGEAPEEVTITSSNGNVEYIYNPQDQTFVATKTRKKIDNRLQNAYDLISNGLYYNYWTIKVKYPSMEKALYDSTINISIDSYAYATNNVNIGYEDAKSNEINQIITHTIPSPAVEGNLEDSSVMTIGSHSKTTDSYYVNNAILTDKFLGKDVEENMTYPVNWFIRYRYTTTNTGKVMATDYYDYFKSADDTKEYTTYKRMQLVNNSSVKDTIVTLYNDETNEVLNVFNKDNFTKVYEFPEGVRSIRLEMDNHEINVNYAYNAYITKQIDPNEMVKHVTLQQYNTYTTLTSGFKLIDCRPTSTNNTVIHTATAHVTPRVSNTNLILDKYNYEPASMAEASFPMQVTIDHIGSNKDTVLYNTWQKGTYLLIFGENVIDVKLNTSYSYLNIEKVMIGNKIGLKIKSNIPTNEIKLNLNITVNPRTVAGTNYIELYSADDTAYKYNNEKSDIYDINENGNVIDKVQYNSNSFTLNVPKELITGAQIKNYDSKNSTTISPLIADVEIMDGRQEADMEIFMINNSTNSVSDIVLMGKTGYAGNTYQIGEGELGSEFTANIKSAINLPSELEGKARIYYSTKSTPTKDIDDSENNWVENPSDFSLIRSYMIVVDGDYALEPKGELTFTYKITVPNRRENLMKVSYFNHGIYFNYLTDNGKYATNVSSGKLGVRISRKVNLNIKNLKIYSSLAIKGNSFKVEDEEGNTYTATTNNLGKVSIEGLYAEKEYKLVQTYATRPYVLDDEEKTFKIELDEYNNASIKKTGIYKSIEFNDNKNLNIELENEMYYSLRLNVSDIDTDEKAAGVEYIITGKGFEDGKPIYTDDNGTVTLYGLRIGGTYGVKASASNDYIPTKYFEIVLTRNMTTKEVDFGIKGNVPMNTVSYDNPYYHFTLSSSSSSYSFTNNIQQNGKTNGDIFEIDLSNYYGEYKLSTYVKYSIGYNIENAYLKMYLSDTKIKDKPFFEGTTSNYTGTIENRRVNIDGEKLIGGKKYYLILEAQKDGTSPYEMTIKPSIKSAYSNYAYQPENAGRTDLSVSNGSGVIPNVKKSLYNYDVDNTSNAIVEVNIKAKKVFKYDLTINKIDSDTNEPLKGAIFKIEGPGLSASGNYLITDENGQATITLNKYMSGSISYIPGLENGYDIDAYYTISEVLAPAGYKTENKSVKFRYTRYHNNPVEFKDSIEYETLPDGSNNEFLSATPNDNKLTVSIGNSPIVKITKKDEDTGELLPNTYFTIEKVERLNSVEQLTPAVDSNGNILGEKTTINGKTYYTVKTDANGQLNLNLSEGTYKLVEVKASSEKYDISSEVYYFSIGKTVGMQPESINMVSAYAHNDYYPLLITSDGGYITNNKKYSSNGELEFEFDTDFSDHKYTYRNEYIYLDNSRDDSFYEGTGNLAGSADGFSEVNDGYLYGIDDNTNFVKYNKQGEIEYITREKNPKVYRLFYNNGTSTYYYYNNYLGYYKTGNKKQLSNGNIGVIAIRSNGYSSNDGFILKDGTEVLLENKYGYYAYYIEYDTEGYLVKAMNIHDKLVAGIDEYISENNLTNTYTTYVVDRNDYERFIVDEDGNYIILFGAMTNGYQSLYVAKLDKDFNNIYTRPLGFMGHSLTDLYSTGFFKFNNDGTYTAIYQCYYNYTIESPYYSEIKSRGLGEFFNTKYNRYGDITLKDPEDNEHGHEAFVAVKYDKDGNVEKAYEMSEYKSYGTVPNINSSLYSRMHMFDYYIDCLFLEDGSVIVGQNIGYSYYTNQRTVYLANGDKYVIPNKIGMILYKINTDSKIEYVNFYEGLKINDSRGDSSAYRSSYSLIDNNNFYISLKSTLESGSTEDLIPNDPIDLYDENNRSILAKFNIKEEVVPAAPESYILELVNKVKEFGINIMTTEGGKVTVKDGDRVIYDGKGPKEIEKVKFSEDNKYDIYIIPDDGYDVVSIKINDEDATYTVQEDGSILLDKIKNITEPKDITVKFKQGVGRLTVHHYLTGTTDRVASDQVVTGNINTEYTVLPIDSKLYSLVKDNKGEYILPENYNGTFKREKQEVTFYYEPRMVKLIISYYEDGTTNKLADTTEKMYILGSEYITKALNIKNYQVTNVLGDEQGFINEDELEVTYFYEALKKSKITVIYKNVDDGTEYDRFESEVEAGSYYSTEGMSEIPEGYELKNIEGVPSGIAEYENITVTYNYGRKKVKVPETSDNIMSYIILEIVSIITVIISILYISKKKAN